MSLRIKLFITLILTFGLLPAANAVSVEFNGATADVSIVSSTDNGDTTTYQVVYTFDFSGWDPSSCVDTSDDGFDSCGAENTTHLGAIDFGFGGPETPDAELVSTTASGGWTLSNVVANAGGCDGGGTNSICAEVDPLHSVAISGTYEWVFEVTYSNDYVPSDEDAAIRAWFVQCAGEYECGNAGLMSLRTNVPEPGTLGMLGVGLVLLGVTRRRRKVDSTAR